MNGLHDMGGMHGFGPVAPAPPGEKLFEADWERRAFALLIAAIAAGLLNMDEARDGVERMDPLLYLRTVSAGESYYWRWLCATEILLDRKQVITHAARRARLAGAPGGIPQFPSAACLAAADVPRLVAEGGSARAPTDAAPLFQPGQRVRARVISPAGHTRLPRYVRGRTGTIVRDHGSFVFPDASAAGQGPAAQHVYLVRFTMQELWGVAPGRERDSLMIDLWDDYLEPA